MADASHSQKLREGVREWNAWRRDNPDIAPRLEDLHLPLRERQLTPDNGAPIPINLSRACLDRAILRHARLIGASFKYARLVDADLTNARLDAADFANADLTRAVMDDADLAGASFKAAILKGACLRRARNLTQKQVDLSIGDEDTVLPPELIAPESWGRSDASGEGDVPAVIRAFLRDDPDDLYSALRVSRDATEEDISQAFHRCVLILHPDCSRGDRGTEDAVKKLSDAARILRDPAKRKAYDLGRIGADGKLTTAGLRRERRHALYAAAGAYFVAPFAVGTALMAVVVWMKSPEPPGPTVVHVFDASDPTGNAVAVEVLRDEQPSLLSPTRQGGDEKIVLAAREPSPVAMEAAPTTEGPLELVGATRRVDGVEETTAPAQSVTAQVAEPRPAEIASVRSDPWPVQSVALSSAQVPPAREVGDEMLADAPPKAAITTGSLQRLAKAPDPTGRVSPATGSRAARGEAAPVKAFGDRSSLKMAIARLARLKKAAKPKALAAAVGAKPPKQARLKAARPAAATYERSASWPSADEAFADPKGRVR